MNQQVEGPDALAALMHQAWRAWMTYLLAASTTAAEGQLVVPAHIMRYLKKQMDTAFAELDEQQKTAHRIRAARITDLLAHVLAREYADVLTWPAGKERNAAAGVLLRLAERLGVQDLRARAESLEE